MIKKLQLFSIAVLSVITLNGQNKSDPGACGTLAPPPEWDEWFNKAVEQYKENLQTGKTQMVNHVIPVIVHIVHYGEAVGTFPNIDTNQVKSQIDALNADFAGTGLNVGNLPAAFSGLTANTGITFCRATKNPQGGALLEPGIQRINANTNGWINPNTPTINIQTYINTLVIPSTIFDPVRYLNIWISERAPTPVINSFGTYPAGTSMSGIFGPGVSVGTVNNDGIWVWTKAFGTVGTIQTPNDKGRTATHQIGHWLGLRHIWGDGNCMTDYCADTPPARDKHTGCPTVPVHIDRCGVGQSPYGEMSMNFMDESDDVCKYLFTKDQNVRIQTAMSQCPFRNALGTHNLCPSNTLAAAPAFSGFNIISPACIGMPFTPFNTSSGNPSPTYVWSSTPPVAFNPAPSVANPAITLSTPGNYTLTLVATNSISSSTYTMAINSVTTCPFMSTCHDSIKMIKNIDTLTLYDSQPDPLVLGCQTGFTGFLTGTNCFKDREFAQFYPASSFTSVPSPQVNSIIVLFDSADTKGNASTAITCRVYGGNNVSGPGAQLGTTNASLSQIAGTAATHTLSYVGSPTYTTSTAVIPFIFNFASPVIISSPASGFFASVETPYLSTGDSIRIYSSKKAQVSVDSNAWFLQFFGNWKTMRTWKKAKIQLGIIPIITCSPMVGIKEQTTAFTGNVNIIPNPSEGLFNLVFTFPKEESIHIRIYNSMGIEISNAEMPHVRSQFTELDMSHQANGIYFAEISNGHEKMVKKIVISH